MAQNHVQKTTATERYQTWKSTRGVLIVRSAKHEQRLAPLKVDGQEGQMQTGYNTCSKQFVRRVTCGSGQEQTTTRTSKIQESVSTAKWEATRRQKMGLKDTIDIDEKYPMGEVTSKKDPRDLSFDEEEWLNVLAVQPTLATYFMTTEDEQGMRQAVRLLGKVAQDNVTGVKVADDKMRIAEETREEIIRSGLEA